MAGFGSCGKAHIQILDGWGSNKILHFQERFKEDVVYMSSSCAHGVEQGGEVPTFTCKGIVLDFLESEIAAACGAAAFVSARGTRAIAAGKSEELVSCPYCRGAVFVLDPRICFMNRYDDLEDMVVASSDDPRLTGTLGSVCENGHLFLASVGDARRTKGPPVPASGTAVPLIRSGIISFVKKHTEEEFWTSYEAEDFIADLDVVELLEVGQRMASLLRDWPHNYNEGASSTEHDAVELESALGSVPKLKKMLVDYIVDGVSSLEECTEAILDDLEARRLLEERRKEVHSALVRAGYKLYAIPEKTCVDAYIKESAPPLTEVLARQKLAEERKVKARRERMLTRGTICKGKKDGTPCNGQPAAGCSHAACRLCCRTYKPDCVLNRHRFKRLLVGKKDHHSLSGEQS